MIVWATQKLTWAIEEWNDRNEMSNWKMRKATNKRNEKLKIWDEQLMNEMTSKNWDEQPINENSISNSGMRWQK